MKVEVSTDTRVEGTATVVAAVTSEVEGGLSLYKDRLTRVEVHLSDVNGPRSGVDYRCALEARPAGRDPVAVTHEAVTTEEALKGAIGKMDRLLASTFGRLDQQKGGISASGLPT